MTALLSVLLHLILIVSPGTYYDYEIDNIYNANKTQVDAVLNDPVLLPQVITQQATAVELVTIINTEQDD